MAPGSLGLEYSTHITYRWRRARGTRSLSEPATVPARHQGSDRTQATVDPPHSVLSLLLFLCPKAQGRNFLPITVPEEG